ncbi:F1F0 ATP synthase subunit epsilon KNAG_0E02790 [Huiozyma naganishii CBS 8797]|uniref:ATP synthase subunit epsilon, mitochondrial n=1 Tax=Huiozyma naganishii (strain ATCC MYA-139 / BCRC 22969 / CBS 8797 / KCTC 17520 / NBRC 10181 / NCYC 3082 / Yp74L-3) TaxID=1071383 RepID=J7RLX3_HUIN7|nr:hypothetical protein KNAG_0E02790 [Kazachstania naganishii CBS 8797]CCK70538.1 hypothetical protein KNAG_0E02790 [Kazachstania naganishii CBS 8797]
MSAYWKKAGITYATYLNVTAKTLRSALKNELQTQNVLSRGTTDAAYTVYEKGTPKADPQPLQETS